MTVTATPVKMHPIAEQLNEVRTQLNATYLERADVVLCMLLAILSKEHMYVLGPPGTAKSAIVRAFWNCIVNARKFECALSKTRPVEAVLGPLDIKEFREHGHYLVKRKGFLSDVELAFVDEVGKMSPILGHDLLALANERIIHEVNGGLSSRPAPLYTMFTASNELITNESDDAAAFWDRLLIRCTVDFLKDDDNFIQLLTGDMSDPDVKIDWDELATVIDTVVPAITMSDEALKGMRSLRHEFRREFLNPSDRRWRQTVRALKGHAFLNGRSEVIEDDLAVLRFMLWDTPEQIDKVSRMCMIAANPHVETLLQIKDALAEVDNAISERTGDDAQGNDQLQARRHYGKEANRKLQTARDQLDALLMEANGRPIPTFKQVSDEHLRVLLRTFMVCLEQDEQTARKMIQKRLGSGDGGNV